MKKFSSSLRFFLIKTNTKTTNVFEFTLIMIQNISKKSLKSDERIATLKRNLSQ